VQASGGAGSAATALMAQWCSGEGGVGLARARESAGSLYAVCLVFERS
jgi:hypothetical protein